MRIKIINPNTSEEMTHSIAAASAAHAWAGTEILCVNPASGPESIESYFDESLAVPALLEEIARGDREEGVDAYVIACFGDPGLWAARELTEKPVVGIGEAAIAVADFLAPSFSVVDVLERSRHMTEELIRRHGAQHRCRSVRTTNLAVLDFVRDPDRGLRALEEESRRAVCEDGAESILLGCAGFVDFMVALRAKLGVPVVDGVIPALKFAEALVAMGYTTSRIRTFKPPEPKRITGYPGLQAR
jgi:allantoin racemase